MWALQSNRVAMPHGRGPRAFHTARQGERYFPQRSFREPGAQRIYLILATRP